MPLRVALIGLSANAATSWAATAHLPALLSPALAPHYTITALCNSSTAAAQAAIAFFHLPASTKAYGDPAALAADPDVDLVVCNTRVDRHLLTVLPSLRAGKAAYVEWPLTASPADTAALVAAAQGARTLVGLQGRVAAPYLTLRRELAAGRIGRVLSVDVRAFGGTIDREMVPEALAYFLERRVGGNPITIGFAHLIDAVQAVLGELAGASVRMHLQRPRVRVRDAATREVTREERSDVPDLVGVHGVLADGLGEGAMLTAVYRRGQPFPGEPGLRLSVHGEKGEVRLVAPAGANLQADAYDLPVTIEVHDFATDAVEQVAWDWTDAQKGVPVRARSVLATYLAFAEGGEGVVGVEEAARRAAQIQGWLDAWTG